jgi:uncharacterized membrane protein
MLATSTILIIFIVAIVLTFVLSRRSAKAKREKQAQQPGVTKSDEPRVTREKETIREREIVKIRCSHCKQLYEESKGRCPYCGGT